MYHTILHQQGQLRYWRRAGDSTRLPIVLLHGFCEAAELWLPWLAHLPASLPLIIPDLPGFGGSDLQEGGMEAYAEAVMAVLEAEGVGACLMIGHSMGGYTALAFAEKYPEKIAGLGLFHSHAMADDPARKENRLRGIEMIISGKKDLYVAQLFPNLFTPAFCAGNPALVEQATALGRRQSDAGIVAALESMMNRPDRSSVLANCPFPVLWLLGREDTLFTPEAALKAAVQTPVSQVVVLPGVAHMGMIEAPEACATAMTRFWEICSLFRTTATPEAH